ncbi:MAG: patatin-like phospholipase family protein [Oscillospiraceae bacterium]
MLYPARHRRRADAFGEEAEDEALLLIVNRAAHPVHATQSSPAPARAYAKRRGSPSCAASMTAPRAALTIPTLSCMTAWAHLTCRPMPQKSTDWRTDMELKLDRNKTYGLALEGGGAKGAYQIGAWKALREAGIRFSAVSGTSVGALNGAMIVMDDLEKAENVWNNIHFSQVMDVDDEEMRRLMNRDIPLSELKSTLRSVADIVRNRGFDVTPLRKWVAEVVDADKICHSGTDFFIVTYSLTDHQELELKASDLDKDELCDMLLASAYLPAFRLEKLGGKYYADGGVQDVVPIHALVENGCKDIIALRIFGFGIEKRFRIPDDVHVTTIGPTVDLGNILNFDAEQSRQNMRLGYFDAQRVLYGLYGSSYYIDRTMSGTRRASSCSSTFGRRGLTAHVPRKDAAAGRQGAQMRW